MYLYNYFCGNNRYTGNWYGYYIINEGNKVIIKQESWKIKLSITNKLSVYVETIQDSKLTFNGILYEESGKVIAIVKANEYEETVICRYSLPIPGNDKLLIGLYSGLDFNGIAAVGPTIISRDILDNAKVTTLINNNLEIDVNSKVIRTKF